MQFQFLVRIVAQLRENGRSINWQKIEMPGRTVKSMQNMWTKINKLIAEVEQETGETPIKRPTRMCYNILLLSFGIHRLWGVE